jgi:hypothetical protein
MISTITAMLRSDHSLARTVDAYRTAEFATLTPDGTPIAWPTAILRGDDGTLLVTTSPAFPQKALNVRRDGRMALLLPRSRQHPGRRPARASPAAHCWALKR